MAYTLSLSATSINEGSTITVILDTTGLPNGTLVPYAITGTNIDTADFRSGTLLTGNFRITNNQGRITLDVKNDLKTEFNEEAILTLTGTGNNEAIAFTLLDTSKTTITNPVDFTITSSTSIVQEGSYATFYAKAANLTSGTSVAYRILGITPDDLASGSTTGILTFNSTGVPNETQANVTLGVLEDFLTEGSESMVLVLLPDFPYSLRLTSSITVQDVSKSIAPVYQISADKNKVFEGDSVTFTLTALNTADGTILPWSIIPVKGQLSLGDFDGLASLTGQWPALVGNSASLTITTRDDYLYEQTESFYVAVSDKVTSGVIEILDSGNTLLSSDDSYTGNITIEFLDVAVLSANIGGMAISKSHYKDTSGQLSENIVLEGRNVFATEADPVYYQPFSYVIRSSKSIEEWGNAIKTMLHPAGLTFFSEINNETQPVDARSVSPKITSDLELDTFALITADSTTNSGNIRVDSVSSLYNLQ